MKKLVTLFISLIYAALLASAPMEGVMDRDNYLEMARVSPLIIARHAGNGMQSVLANEPVWLAINSALGFLFEDEVVVRIIVFFSAFIVSYLLLINNPKNFFWLLLILVFPQVMKNFVIHLRQGLAIAVFMLGWFSSGNKKRVFFIGLTPFIHSSFFIIIAILLGNWLLKKLRAAPDFKLLLYFTASLSLALLVTQVAALIGARQAKTTAVMEGAASGVGFLFWSAILVILLLQGRQFIHKYSVAIGILIFYLASYFFTPIAGRVFESGVLLVLLAVLATTGWRRIMALTVLLAFNIALMLVQYSQPLMGFAAS
ncbi:EpsG family protein [Rheinheimera aquimaris]|uniref:EpsG family protein n=1 Tax=Rheinheimera aquimaris TaxID=412437 RepID=UPI001E3D7DED|nr:EpsG family protein [Rheinheimera aquimaris]MCD1599828.1 EpsG family protein [Rheinheimera aquimaris]